jgi:beta-lactamase regulating signal transducer with metallopeptidase domain
MTFAMALGEGTVQALGLSLLHFLWQGTAVAAALAAADALVSRRSSTVRYALAVSALAVMAVLPLFTFARLMGMPGGEVAPAGTPSLLVALEPAGAFAVPGPEGTSVLGRSLAATLPTLVAAWALGVALLSARVVGGWTVAQRLARSGRPTAATGLAEALARLCAAMGISRPVRLLESARVEIPTVIGWLRPVILFPAATLAGLTPAQLEVVLAHELAHVRRLDYLVNLLQTAVETLLFYHPAVWWVSQRVRVEREHCCDDAAVAACGDALAYARALTDLEGLRVSAAGLAMAADGGSLLQRVGRLVGGPTTHGVRASRVLGGILALLIPAVVVGSGWLEVRGQAQPAPDAVEGEATPAPEPKPEPVPAPQAQGSVGEATEKPAAAGELTIEQVLELAHAGVTPEYLDDMAAAGYPSLGWRELIELRSQGVDPEFVKGMAVEGHSGLSPRRLVELRSQGVDPAFVRGLREQGLDKLSPSNLIELRSQGVSPEFVKEMKAAVPDPLSTTDLVTLRSQGVSGEYVRELKALGYGGLSTTKLVGLRSQGVTPEYVRGLKELGYDGLSVPMLIGLRSQGVTPEYVRGLKDAGYSGLAAGVLMELRSQGVTEDFVRELKQAGYERLTPEDLMALRSQGVGAELLRRLRRDARPGPKPEPR